MTDSASVRPYNAADAEACIAIVAGLPDYFTPDVPATVREDLRRHSAWVVTEADAVAGFAVVDRRSSKAVELLWAAVAAERRRRGLGTLLVEHVLDALAGQDVHVVEVKTLDKSAGYEPYVATRGFWEARGFVQIDTIDPLPGWEPGNPSAFYVATLKPTR